MKTPFYKGAAGNLSLHVVTLSLAAVAASAEVLASELLPIGTEITGVRLISDALGAGTAVKLDLVDNQGGSKSVLASTVTTAAKADFVPIKPVYIGDEGASDLILTNSGTGPATGEVTVQLEYRFKGY